MKKAPNLIKVEELQNWSVSMLDARTGNWIPARAEGYYSLWNRLKMAYLVFVGRCDALMWGGNQ